MANATALAERIDAEFAAAKQKVAEIQQQSIQGFQEKKQRLELFEKTLDELRDVVRPRLETLAKRFIDQVKVVPSVQTGRREAIFQFQSELARINLRFTVLPDADVRNAVFVYDLEILPILMQFDSHQVLKLPLDNVDADALADWIDARIVSFVQAYLALHQNTYYLKDHLVEDPVAKIRFPKYAAGAQLDRKGKTIYFLNEETRKEFEEREPVGAK